MAKRWLRWIPIGAIVVFAIVVIAAPADEAKPHSASSVSSGTDTTFMDLVNLFIHVHFDQQAKLRQEFGNIAPTVTGVNCLPTALWHEFRMHRKGPG